MNRIEKKLFQMLSRSNKLYDTRKYKSEWFALSITQIKKAFQDIHKKEQALTQPPILEWSDPFISTFQTSEGEVKFKEPPPRRQRAPNKRRTRMQTRLMISL